MSLELVRENNAPPQGAPARSIPRIVEFSGQEIYQRAGEIFERLSARTEIILIRGLPEILHVRELLLDFIRKNYSGETALKVKAALFDGAGRADEYIVSAFVAATRHLRDTGAMSALFSGLVDTFDLPQPVTIDCGYFRLVAPNDIFSRMERRHDLVQREDWYNAPPFSGTEPIFMRGSAMPHRDISRPYYAFQMNFWFPLIDLGENESLMFFPDAFYDYKERVERLSGGDSQGFEHDVRTVGARIAANPNPLEWGFGKPASRRMDFGDVYLFYSQQVHGSPVRRADTLRLSVEMRVSCRCLDDNTGYRRIFSNLNNFLPVSENSDATVTAGIERADALADVPHQPAERAACAQLFLNSLFPAPILAREAKEVARSPGCFDLASEISGDQLKAVAKKCEQFPFAEDRSMVLARLFLRRGEDEEAANVLAKASKRSESYFWQLHLAQLAIRAHRKELARSILERCRMLAERTSVDTFPFAPALGVPADPIIAILPDHALRAVAAISDSIGRLPDDSYGPDAWYRRDPRLFHPHSYYIKTQDRADFYNSGSLFVAIPTGRLFVPEEIVGGATAACFGETMEELEYEYKKHQNEFPALAPGAATAPQDTSMVELEQRLRTYISERLKPVEEAIEERTGRINSLETALEERNHRLKTVEADLQSVSNAVQRTMSHRLAVLLRRFR